MLATLDDLDDRRMAAFYDPGSVERGRAYAAEGRIQLLNSHRGSITAACQGSRNASYIVRVSWTRYPDSVTLDDSCTCPLGGGCKHCVAAIVTARRDGLAAPDPASEKSPPGSNWRRVLAGLAADEDGSETGPEPLALRFEVRHPKPSRYSDATSTRVLVQPARLGKSGRWIKSGATWRDISSQYHYRSSDLDTRHIAALRTLLASATDGSYFDDSALTLDRFGPESWHQLHHASDLGIKLLGANDAETVHLSPTPAQAEIDVVAAEHGDVSLSARFTHDDLALQLGDDACGLIGTPAHGLWVNDDSGLHLVALNQPMHPAVARLVGAGVVTVPAADVDELLDAYQLELARHAKVGSSDASVVLTSKEFEHLVVRIERTALDVATLTWTARYRRGQRSVDHSLLGPGGRFRDRDAETLAISELKLPTDLLPALVDDTGSPRNLTVQGHDMVILLTEVVPWLETTGNIEVEIFGDQPELRDTVDDPLISLTVTDGDNPKSGNDWFDLGVEVSVDGQSVDFTTLFAALNDDASSLILESGTVLRLDSPEFTKLRELISEARSLVDPSGPGVARINRFQTSWWEDLVALGVVSRQSSRWEHGIEQMAALSAPTPVALPEGLDAVLRPYQQEGLDWLGFLHRNRLGGILGDDMGLGKTIQTLALALHILEEQPAARFLVVAPTSVVENWAREAARFAPSIKTHTIDATMARNNSNLSDEIGDASLVVTSYALFRIDFDAYATHDWEVLMLDEAQFVKNHNSKTYQCARRLDVATKIAITGTPMENSLMDLWSLLSITAPGLYPDPKRFSRTYRKPIERGDAPELLATLRRRIAPLLLRRTKDAVLDDLPPKTELTVEIELNARHARIYATQLQRQRQKVLGLVGDVRKHRFEILKSLTILRQLALDPGLIDEKHDNVGSAKLDRLLDDLTQIVAEGHRALVFSQFTRYLSRVRSRLDDADIAYSYLDGRTRKRDAAISHFKDGDVPVFVISLKAGGFGLNLTEADYCFILDPWWNPATETQAVDRTHRIGQENPVMVYRYVSTNTIEEKVMELKARKAGLFSSVLDADGTLSGALNEDDIRGLLDIRE